MDLTHFIARLLGAYMIFGGLFYLFRPENAKEAICNIMQTTGLRLFIAFFGLLMGLAILLAHPVYTFGLGGVVTLLGVVMVVRGLLEMFAPHLLTKAVDALLQEPRFQFMSLIVLGLGVCLSYFGWN